jgi:DNA-binding CsgD family transcriptional regulator
MFLETWNGSSELVLEWSRGATVERLEGFQSWALEALRIELPFDHAIWGLGPKARPAAGRIHLAQIHCQDDPSALEPDEMEGLEALAVRVRACGGRASIISMDEADAQFGEPLAWSAWARRFASTQWLCIESVDPQSGTVQFIALGRVASAPRFGADERAGFELLAPHMMQAYTTRRVISTRGHQPHARPHADWTTAMVDIAGHVLHHDPEFFRLLEREWPAAEDARLAEPLRRLMTSHLGARFRHTGQHIVAEFSPTRGLFLVSIRQRVSDDMLSERERRIAQQYSSGASYREIAEALQLSPSTVRAHLRTVFLKLGVRKKAHLAGLLH